jgi:hypothetical protein
MEKVFISVTRMQAAPADAVKASPYKISIGRFYYNEGVSGFHPGTFLLTIVEK